MNSGDTRKIIKKIAEEEGISEWAVRMIVMSEFEGVSRVIQSGIRDKPETFKNIVLNAFGAFNVMPSAFNKFKKSKRIIRKRRIRHDSRK
jgi:uncharacterized protein YjaZ